MRANLLAITAHLSDNDKLRVSAFLREFTGNIPLVFAVKLLFKNSFLSQAHRVALEEGFIVALTDYIKKCTPLLATLEFKNIFMYFR